MRAAQIGYDVSVVTANSDVAKQIDGINDLIAKGVDGILISPDRCQGGCAAPTTRPRPPVFAMMSIARGSACKSQVLHIAVDEIQASAPRSPNGPPRRSVMKGKVAMLAGPAGAQAFMRFAKGYQDTMAKFPNIKIAFKHELLLTRENGLKYGEDALVAHPDLKAIYGANDELGLGAAQAAAAAGLKAKVVVTGMNGIPPAVRAVKRGKPWISPWS